MPFGTLFYVAGLVLESLVSGQGKAANRRTGGTVLNFRVLPKIAQQYHFVHAHCVTGSIKWPLRPLYGSNAPFIVMILSLELDLLAPNFRFHFPDYRDEEGTKLDG
jgi:hypothetical protein